MTWDRHADLRSAHAAGAEGVDFETWYRSHLDTLPMDEIDLPVRAINVFIKHGVTTVGHVRASLVPGCDPNLAIPWLRDSRGIGARIFAQTVDAVREFDERMGIRNDDQENRR